MTPTPRELAALRAYLETGSYKDAALRLGITTHTLRNHLAHARFKCRARTTAEAVFILHDRLVT